MLLLFHDRRLISLLFSAYVTLSLASPQPQYNGSGDHNSSSPTFYGYQFGSSRSDYSSSIWTDNNGNTFVTGNTNSSSLFQNQLTSGAQDIFVSKHDLSNGSLVWGLQFGSPLPDSGIAISSLRSENRTSDIFVTGYTTGKLFERMNSTLWYVEYDSRHPNTATHEVTLCPGERFVASTSSYYWGTSSARIAFRIQDPFGNWTVSSNSNCPDTLQYDFPHDSLPCTNLALVIECLSSSSKCIATIALIITEPNSMNETLVDGFLTRHNSETGEMIWGVQFGTSSCDVPYAVDISPWDSDVYVVGGTRGSLYSNRTGSEDVFVGKYNSSNGELIWGYQHGSFYSSYASSVVCDEHGNVYVLGYSFGNFFNLLQTNNGNSIITMKLSSDGVLIWGKQYGVTDQNFGLSIAIGTDESLFISGYAETYYDNSPYSFLFKLHSSTGDKIWKIEEAKKFGWSISIVNSSVFVASTILRQEKNKFHLSKYDGDTGKKLWGLNYASVPTADAPPEFLRASVSINQNDLLRVSGSVSSNLFVDESYGEVDFIILSPNICPPGSYSTGYTSACEICPSNTFSSEASHKCTDCPHGFLSNPGSRSCNIECYGGYFSNAHSICFHTDQHLLYYLLGLIVPVYLLTLTLLALSWVNIGFAYTSLVSTFDFLSDILYLTTSFFYNETLFYASILLLLPAFLPLISDLCLKISANKNTLRLLDPPFFLISGFPKYSVGWSVLWVSILLVWSILMVPYAIVSLVFGYYLMQTKLLSLPFYERLWHNINFSNEFSHGNLGVSATPRQGANSLNLHVLNRAVLTEIWCEAVPQIIVQSVNNVRMRSFGLVPRISLVSSVLLIVNSYYRIFYFNLIHRIPLSEIPAHLKTPLSPLITMRSKVRKLSTTVKHQLNSLFTPTDDGKELTQHQSSSVMNATTSILVSFEKGETGIVLKKREGSSNKGSVEELSVFLISEGCTSYSLGVRRGYVVDSINGMPSSRSEVVLRSNYCGEPCEVVFRPPRNQYVAVRLESQIQEFKQIGLVVSLHKSCFHDVSYYQVDLVDPHSICYESGVRTGARIMSINRKTFVPQMRLELFSSSDCLEKFLWSYCRSCERCSGPPLIVFKNKQSEDWFNDWSTDQEILNNHLRSVFFLIVTSKNGVPHIGRIPFFFTEVLDNFPTFCLFSCAWFLVIIIQLCWIGLWMVWYSLTIPFTLPWTLLGSIYQLRWPFQFSHYVLVILSLRLAWWTWLVYYASNNPTRVWRFWIIIHGFSLTTTCLGALVFQPYTSFYVLLLLGGYILVFGFQVSLPQNIFVSGIAITSASFVLLITMKIFRSRSSPTPLANTARSLDSDEDYQL